VSSRQRQSGYVLTHNNFEHSLLLLFPVKFSGFLLTKNFKFSLECLINLHHMKLLIVEDEPALLEEMKNFLEKEHYVCETAANFNDADEKLSVYHYDVALIDITLP